MDDPTSTSEKCIFSGKIDICKPKCQFYWEKRTNEADKPNSDEHLRAPENEFGENHGASRRVGSVGVSYGELESEGQLR